MDSIYVQHQDGVVTVAEDVPAAMVGERVSPAALMQAQALVVAAPTKANQHPLVRTDGHRHEIYWENTQSESFVVGDLDYLTLSYYGGDFHVIVSVHGGDDGVFKRYKFVVKYEGAEGHAPITKIFLVDLSEHVHKWMHNFIGHIMQQMNGGTIGHMYDVVSAFCSVVSNNSIQPPPLINCEPTEHSKISVDECPPWINLPLDCYRLILDCLDAFAILRFPLVCKSWAEVYAEKRRLQPGAPTLLTSPSVGGNWHLEDPNEWYRGIFFIQNIILSRETFLVEVDDFKHSRWIGGKDEWLVIVDDQEQSFNLLNPITGACTRLVPEDMRACYYIKRIQLCRTPNEANGYFAIAIACDQLAYTMDGRYEWFLLENPNERYYMRMYTDAILHRGKIVAICSNGNLWSWDLDEQGGNPKLLFSSTIYSEGWEERDFILATSLYNDNLLIVSPYGEGLPLREANNRNTFRNHGNFCVHGVVLHEVDIDAGSIEYVHGIDNQALFLGPNYPFYVPVPVPSGDLKTNHIYITDMADSDVVAINLNEDNFPSNVTFIDYNGPWNHPFQVPMWFRPAFP